MQTKPLDLAKAKKLVLEDTTGMRTKLLDIVKKIRATEQEVRSTKSLDALAKILDMNPLTRLIADHVRNTILETGRKTEDEGSTKPSEQALPTRPNA